MHCTINWPVINRTPSAFPLSSYIVQLCLVPLSAGDTFRLTLKVAFPENKKLHSDVVVVVTLSWWYCPVVYSQSGLVLSGAVPSGVDLSGVVLSGVVMGSVGLSGVVLGDVGLSGVVLSGGSLSGVGLSDVGLSGVCLSDVGLSDVGLSGVGLNGVSLSDVSHVVSSDAHCSIVHSPV